jgi:hypothetical protein
MHKASKEARYALSRFTRCRARQLIGLEPSLKDGASRSGKRPVAVVGREIRVFGQIGRGRWAERERLHELTWQGTGVEGLVDRLVPFVAVGARVAADADAQKLYELQADDVQRHYLPRRQDRPNSVPNKHAHDERGDNEDEKHLNGVKTGAFGVEAILKVRDAERKPEAAATGVQRAVDPPLKLNHVR